MDTYGKEIDAHENEIENLQAKIKEVEEEKADLEGKVSKLESDLESKNQKIASLEKSQARSATVSSSSTSSSTQNASTSNSNVYYKNCTAVRAAGKAPLYRGEPGYASHLDRDGDGVACE